MRVGYSSQVVINPTYSVFYNRPEFSKENSNYNRKHNLANVSTNSRKVLSQNAKRKLQKSINYLTYLASEKKVFNPKFKNKYTFKVSFITLTLASSQVHKDSIITNKLLNQFLIEAKKRFGLNRYVWKSEYQRNGNIHYHIITDVFIPHNELLDTWNRIQNKLGYVDEFRKKTHKQKPNSTDIHSLRKVRNMSRYLCKYMVKDMKKNKSTIQRGYLEGSVKKCKGCRSVTNGAKMFLRKEAGYSRIWGCSHDLSNITGAKSDDVNQFIKEFERLEKLNKVKRIDKDNATIFYYDMSDFNYNVFPVTLSFFNQYLQNTFQYTHQKNIFCDNIISVF